MIRVVGCLARIARQASTPEPSGSRTSIRTMSGRSRLTTRTVAALDTASPTTVGKRGYLIWCRRRDLNPHGLRHTPLKRACLPFHHFGTRQELEKPPQLRSRVAQTLNVLSSMPRDFACCGLIV